MSLASTDLDFVPTIKQLPRNVWLQSHRVLSRITSTNKRSFISLPLDRAQFQIESDPGTLHEVLSDKDIVKFYLDLDAPFDRFESERKANAFVMSVIHIIKETPPMCNYKLRSKDVLLLAAHRDQVKWSYHVRLQFRDPVSGKPVGMPGPKSIKLFLQNSRLLSRVAEPLRDIIDLAVYGAPTQQIRCAYASKSLERGKFRPLLPVDKHHRQAPREVVVQDAWVALRDDVRRVIKGLPSSTKEKEKEKGGSKPHFKRDPATGNRRRLFIHFRQPVPRKTSYERSIAQTQISMVPSSS